MRLPIAFFPFHVYAILCVSLSHKMSVKDTATCSCNVTKCEKFQVAGKLFKAQILGL